LARAVLQILQHVADGSGHLKRLVISHTVNRYYRYTGIAHVPVTSMNGAGPACDRRTGFSAPEWQNARFQAFSPREPVLSEPFPFPSESFNDTRQTPNAVCFCWRNSLFSVLHSVEIRLGGNDAGGDCSQRFGRASRVVLNLLAASG
jgi:hypothetical protein